MAKPEINTCECCGHECFEFNISIDDHRCSINLKNRLSYIKEIILGAEIDLEILDDIMNIANINGSK